MRAIAIDHTHLFVPVTDLGLDSFKEKFVVRSRHEKPGGGGRATAVLYKEVEGGSGHYLGIPRHYPLERLSILTSQLLDKRSSGHSIEFKVNDNPNHPNAGSQNRIINSFKENWVDGKTGFVFTLPTGFGKTVIGLRVLSRLGVTSLIIVPKTDLVKQWRDRIVTFTDLKQDDIGLIQQDRCEFQGKKIVIGMLHSLALRKKPYPKEMFGHFGCVLFDEVHRASSEKLGIVSGLFPSKYRIGLTATPNRSDGMEDVFKWTIGECMIGLEVDDMPAPTVLVKRLKLQYPDGGLRYIKEKTYRGAKIKSILAEFEERNLFLAKILNKSFQANRQSVLISDRTCQLDSIRLMLIDLGINPESIGIYKGKVSNESRKKILDSCGIVLGTYGALGEGTDAPNLSLLVYGTPRSGVKQVVGRIRRIKKGKKPPVVYDIIDAYSDCEAMFHARMRDYKSMNAKIVVVS